MKTLTCDLLLTIDGYTAAVDAGPFFGYSGAGPRRLVDRVISCDRRCAPAGGRPTPANRHVRLADQAKICGRWIRRSESHPLIRVLVLSHHLDSRYAMRFAAMSTSATGCDLRLAVCLGSGFGRDVEPP